MSLQQKNGMTQEVASNPNTNIVQFHVQEKNQETWAVIDYNAVSLNSRYQEEVLTVRIWWTTVELF